jgi:hypothetical protein
MVNVLCTKPINKYLKKKKKKVAQVEKNKSEQFQGLTV